MEEILKVLQGKSLTKKKLFDFLADINIEDLDNKKDSIIKKKLFSHISRGIDCPINSSITISFGSDDGKDFFIVLFKK